MEDIFHLGIKALITNAAGEVLLLKVDPALIKRRKPAGQEYWDLPGGRVQKGENIGQTLRREIQEEIGVSELEHITPLGMVLANMRLPVKDDTDEVGLILGIYTCTIPDDAQIRLSHEHIAYAWLPKPRAADLLRTKFSQEFCDLLARL